MPINIDHRQNIIVTDDSLLNFNMTGSIKIPTGTTGQRPVTPLAGMIRYNTTTGGFEGYTTTWGAIGGGYTSTDFDTDFSGKSTTNLSEGTNLYYTSTRANAAIDARVNTAFIDALNVDADTLDGQDGLYYLDYTNFSNTPTIPVTGVDFDPVGTDNSTDVTLAGTLNYLTLVGQVITLAQVDATTDISGLATVATTGAYSDLTGAPSIPSTTTDLSEGTNLYYTQGRFDTAFTAKSTTDLSEGTNLYYTQGRFDTAFTAKSTTDLSEGTNLYYTDERVDDRVAVLAVAGSNMTITYDDGANTLTFESAAGATPDLSTSDLTDMGDVSATGLTDASMLIYDVGTTSWRPYVISGDVTITDVGVAAVADNSHNHTASNITDFDTEVANNSAVALNTAKVTNVTTDLAYTTAASTGTVTSSDGTDATIPAATISLAGLLTGADKTKLDGIEALATADQTAGEIEAIVNHDNLVGFVANEHIDWTTDQGATNIDPGNYIDTVYTHPSDGVDLGAALTGANVISDVNVNAAGHVTGFATRALTASDVGASATSHTHTASDITDFDTEVANNTAVAANTAKVTNVTTNLSTTAAPTTITINSSDGTNAIIAAADITNAGIMTTTMYDEHVLNNAKVTNVTTDLAYTTAATTGTVTSSDGTDATIPAATGALAGLLTGADKTKLDGIATGANLYVHPSDGVDLGAALTGANVISDVNVNAAGHVTGFATRALTASDVGAASTSHTHAASTITAGNLISTVLPYATAVATASAFKVPFLNTTGLASGNFGLLHDTSAHLTYNPSTNNLSTTTFTGALAGNATTATTLATARTINGTSFNGSANITTANWGTSRTLTIGDTGKAVNGSAAVTWSRTELGITKVNIDALGIAASTATSATTATAWTTGRTITLTGDVTGTSAAFDGSGNLTFATTIATNSVELGTDTTGNYVSTITGTTNEITVTGSGTETAGVTISLPDDVTIGNNLIVTGNLTVSGTTTVINTETISLADNIITLNSDETGTPTQNAGLEIERGTSANVFIRWNESTDTWETTNDGTTFSRLLTTADEGAGNGLDADTLDGQEGSFYLAYANLTGAPSIPSTTTDISEGTNLYYTQGRFDTAFTAKSTTDLSEGTNLYYTDERVDDRVAVLAVAGSNMTITYDDGANTLTFASAAGATPDLSTSDLTDMGDVSAVGLTDASMLIYDVGTTSWRPYVISGDVTISDVGVAVVADNSHNHTASNITDFDTEVSNNTAVAANTAKVTNATHTGDVTGATALTITDNAVTNAKLADVATQTIKGRTTAATGNPEDLTAAQVRAIINVEDGATADQTAGEIEAIVTHDNLLGFVANEHIDWTTDQGATNIDPGNYTDTVYTHPSDGVDLGAALTGANVISDVNVNAAGHVTGFATRALTASDVGAAATSHTHAASTITAGNLISTVLPYATAVATASAFKVPFLNTTTNVSGNYGLLHDTAGLTYNPSTNVLTATTFAGNATTATTWATGRTITLTGDVTGVSAAFNGSGNLSFATTIAANSVALGTDTTGSYVAQGATSGNGLSGSVNVETGTFTVTSNAVSTNTASTLVFRDASGNFSAGTITANLTGQVSTISNFSTTDLSEGTNLYFTDERVDDRVATLIVGGTDISSTYDDGANTLTIAYTGSAGATTLVALSDTNITTPADGAFLIYDTGTATWRDFVMSGDVTVDDSGVAVVADNSHNHTASNITDFDTEVANNSAVTANTAKVTNVTTNLAYTTAASTGTVTSSDGTDATIPAATGALAGLLTGADKTKLDGIATGANLYVHPSDGVDLGAALTGANVISDVNVNAAGHVTGFATRALTSVDLGTKELLTADRTYYIRTDGSDANDGLTNNAGGAFLTILYAYQWITRNIDPGGYMVTFQLANGSYAGGILANYGDGAFTGGPLYIVGNAADASLVTITSTLRISSIRGGSLTAIDHLTVGPGASLRVFYNNTFLVAEDPNLTSGEIRWDGDTYLLDASYSARAEIGGKITLTQVPTAMQPMMTLFASTGWINLTQLALFGNTAIPTTGFAGMAYITSGSVLESYRLTSVTGGTLTGWGIVARASTAAQVTAESVALLHVRDKTSDIYSAVTSAFLTDHDNYFRTGVDTQDFAVETATFATVTESVVGTFPVSAYSSGKFLIQATDTVTSEVHITEILVVHDGTTASATEYAVIYTGASPLATFDVDISGGNVRILATGASANSTTYDISENLMLAV
jgi:hypothetical protein